MNAFEAVSEPNRRTILDAIRREPRTVNQLVDLLGISQPAVSKHLRLLRESGLVVVRPDGQRRWYEVNPAPLVELHDADRAWRKRE